MTNRLPFLALAAVGFGVLGYFAIPNGTPETGLTLNAVQAQDAEVDTSIVQEMTLGAEDAPVTIVEYASFTCPQCATFHDSVLPQIKEQFVDSGQVRFVYREVYFDRYGLWAGMVARCGDGQRYFGIIDMIYDQQRQWTQGDPATIAGNLRRIGLTAGLEPDTVDACMQDATKAQAMYALYQQQSAEDDINSTPSFIINGEKYANMSFAEFSNVIEDKLGN